MCVYQDGKKVVDLWGGTRTWSARSRGPRHHRHHEFRGEEHVRALHHMLIDRGLVDFDAPVSRYWPEFAQAGKAGRAGAPRAVPYLRRDLLRPRAARLVVRLGGAYPRHRAAGARVGTGNEGRLQLDQHRLHPRRDRAAGDGQEVGISCARKWGAARRRVPHRAAARRDRPRLRHASQSEEHLLRDRRGRSTPLGRAFRSAPKTGYFQNCREIRELEVPHSAAMARAGDGAYLRDARGNGDDRRRAHPQPPRWSAPRSSSGRTTAS